MKKTYRTFLLIVIGVGFACLAHAASVARFVQVPVDSNYNMLWPNNITSTGTFTNAGAVTLTALGSGGNPCVTVSSTGLLATSTCGAGAGTIATSTPLVSGQVDFSSGASTIANDANFTWASSTKILNVTSTGRYNIGGVVAVMMPGTTNALFGGSGNLGTNIGIQNTAMGVTALDFLTVGGNNNAFGYSSLIVNTSGTSNNAFGANALQAITTASNNSAFGESAGFSATASGSIFLGYNAGKSLTIGNNDIMIGYNTDFPQTSSSNMLDIANLIYATGLSNFASVTSTVSAGSVGIGTQSPSSTLHVVGQVISTSMSVGTNTNSGLLNIVNGSGTVALNVSTSTNATTTLTIVGLPLFSGSSTVITPSISGAIVGIGCDTATSSVDSSVTSSTAAFVTTPTVFPGAGFFWQTYLSSAGVITTEVCSDVTASPSASTYVVKIIK